MIGCGSMFWHRPPCATVSAIQQSSSPWVMIPVTVHIPRYGIALSGPSSIQSGMDHELIVKAAWFRLQSLSPTLCFSMARCDTQLVSLLSSGTFQSGAWALSKLISDRCVLTSHIYPPSSRLHIVLSISCLKMSGQSPFRTDDRQSHEFTFEWNATWFVSDYIIQAVLASSSTGSHKSLTFRKRKRGSEFGLMVLLASVRSCRRHCQIRARRRDAIGRSLRSLPFSRSACAFSGFRPCLPSALLLTRRLSRKLVAQCESCRCLSDLPSIFPYIFVRCFDVFLHMD